MGTVPRRAMLFVFSARHPGTNWSGQIGEECCFDYPEGGAPSDLLKEDLHYPGGVHAEEDPGAKYYAGADIALVNSGADVVRENEKTGFEKMQNKGRGKVVKGSWVERKGRSAR